MINSHYCENTSCKKIMKKSSINCLNCNFKTCSENCLEEHLNTCDETNKIEEDSLDFIGNNLNDKQSLLIKPGKLLKVLDISPIYDFDNFETLKLGRSSNIISVGTLGSIVLARNINNKKLYCVKQVCNF